METPLEYSVRPSDSVREIAERDGIWLFDVQQSLCFSVNAVGSKIWCMMKMEQSPTQIIDALVAEFNVPKEKVYCDVVTFIEHLYEEGLLLREVGQCAKSAIACE
jgi:hypothetical protein